MTILLQLMYDGANWKDIKYLQLHADLLFGSEIAGKLIGFFLICMWRSACRPGLLHATLKLHTLSLNKTEPCVYNSPAAICSTSTKPNCDLVESCDRCSGTKLEKAHGATQTLAGPIGTLNWKEGDPQRERENKSKQWLKAIVSQTYNFFMCLWLMVVNKT